MEMPQGSRAALTALMLAFFAASTAWADTFNVTRTDDPAPNGCQPADCSLREAVLAANETAGPDLIQLQPLVYVVSLDGVDNDTTGDLDIRTDLAIIGPATLDGQDEGRIIETHDGVTVTLDRLVFQNANTSLASNGALNGGAVQVEGGSLTVRSCVFRNNAAQTHGAGIYTIGGAVLTVRDTVFHDNQAGNGAGIFGNGDVSVHNARFQGNEVKLRGAALYLAGTQSDVVLERVDLVDNEGFGSGGGAVLFLGRELEIENLVATGNRSLDGNGGVLATTGTAHSKSVRISSALFYDNEAEDGGALSIADDDDPVNIAHAAFIDNSVSRQGGAIYTTGGLIDIANATFSGNSAGTDGGALHLFGMDVTLRQVTFADGTANRGSAISIGGSTSISSLSLANSIVQGNCYLANADTLTSLGGNIESPGDTCSLNQASDRVNITVRGLGLRNLQETSGATPSHPLGRGSVARGAGLPAVCEALALDQLFRARSLPCSAGAVDGAFLVADGFETNPSFGSSVPLPP